MMEHFTFWRDFKNQSDEICIKVRETLPADQAKYHVPTYNLSILTLDESVIMGGISFKARYNDLIYYAGNIGYEIYPRYRGKHYAYKACVLLFPLIKYHNMNSVIITCDPDNYPSNRICELLDADKIETVSVPIESKAYLLGMRKKNRYQLRIG